MDGSFTTQRDLGNLETWEKRGSGTALAEVGSNCCFQLPGSVLEDTVLDCSQRCTLKGQEARDTNCSEEILTGYKE